MNAFDRMVLVAAVAVACSGGGGTAPCGSGGTAASVSVCDNFFGPWVADAGMVQFNFLHRFYVTPGPTAA